MTNYTFKSELHFGSRLPEFTVDQVKNEPMLFNCSFEAARELGGPITRAFLSAIIADGEEAPVVVDSRVHMLMPGWFPAIPGWHHDDVPRTGPDNQPNYDSPAYHSRHCMALVNADVAPTEFIIGHQTLPKPDGDGPVYKHWHDLTEEQVAAKLVETYRAMDRELIYFDWQSMHRAVPAVTSGWRWFARASWQTDRRPTNEVRRQVQVYLPNLTEGW